VLALPATSSATHIVPDPPECDEDSFLLTLNVPGTLQHVICSGDDVGSFEFPGIPDGIGIAPGSTDDTINVFLNHEESDVPFPATGPAAAADFQDSTVSRITLDSDTGELVGAEVALPASAGFMRLCSSFMAGPDEGFSSYTYLTGEETNDVVPVEPTAPYRADPSVAPKRQGGLNLLLDADPDGDGDFVAGTITRTPCRSPATGTSWPCCRRTTRSRPRPRSCTCTWPTARGTCGRTRAACGPSR
jgi:hypothetical protein